MYIVNRTNSTIQWKAYLQNDKTCSVPLSGKLGSLGAGQGIDVGMEQDSVKLRVNDVVYDGPFVNTQCVVISLGAVPVYLDETTWKYRSLATGQRGVFAVAQMENLNATAKRTITTLSGVLKGIPKVGSLVSQLLLFLYDPEREPNPPTVEQIRASLAEIVTDTIALQKTSDIVTTWQWMDDFSGKINGLAEQGAEPSADEVQSFSDNLNAALGPNSILISAMETLRNNRDVRKKALHAYLMGIALFAKLKTIAIQDTRNKRPLVAADFTTLQNFLTDTIAALRETGGDLDRDWIALLQKYPLGGTQEGVELSRGFCITTVGQPYDDSPRPYILDQVNNVESMQQAVNEFAASVLSS